MAELPEIKKISSQMKETLTGKTITKIDVIQEKCLNIKVNELAKRIIGKEIIDVKNKGKWILINLSGQENILISLGMGADLLYYEKPDQIPEKYTINLEFDKNCGFTLEFWWFGKFYIFTSKELENEPSIKNIAIDALDKKFTKEYFLTLCKGKRTGVKTFLLNQEIVSGIGNMYIHDILFKSGVHPKKKLSEMPEKSLLKLYDSVLERLNFSINKGSFSMEKDFFGNGGNYSQEDFLVGYRKGKPCPKCSDIIEQIKTGSTSSYICPMCQSI